MSNDILVKVGADITDFSRKMAESKRGLSEFSQTNSETFSAFKKTGAVVTAASAALTTGLGFAVNKAKEFEAGMSKVAAISGSTGDELESLETRARELGASTSFSALEAAEGLEYLALAGWDTTQMIDGLEPVLHLAEAGALDLGRTSDLVTDSMAGLGLEVDDLSGYLDKVAQTAANSNTDIDALMEAMVIAGGTFERLNVPLEESTAFLGVLANRGFKASEAGTAVNAIMTRLTSGTGQAADALADLNISAFDSNGQFKGMEAVMRELEGALGGMDDEMRSHYQSLIAGLNHGKTFNAMLNGLSDEYDGLKTKIVESDGALLEMRNTMKDNLQGALENLSSAFEEIMITIGTALMPVVKLLVSWLQSLADWFNGLSDVSKTTIAVLLAVTAALTAVVGPVLLLVGFIPQIAAGFATLKIVTTAVTVAVTKVTSAMYAKAIAAKVLGTALKVMMGPVGWIIAGVAALTAGVIGIVKWFKRDSAEAKKLKEETEGLAEATDELTESTQSSADAYEEKKSATQAEIKNNEELARKVQDLASKEKLSAGEKEMLRSYTDDLNESMEGLNLAYDEESGKLNQSSEQIQARINLLGEQEKANDAMERAKEITEEQIVVEQQLAEASEKREEWNKKIEEGGREAGKYKDAVAELDEQEKELEATLAGLDEQYQATEAQVEESMDVIAKATKDSVEAQKLSYGELEEHQQKLVDEMRSKWQDIADASTNMFDKINKKAEMSFAEMRETFNHNVKATEEWADNLEKLAQAGVSSAFLDTFREMGPQSAAEVQTLVKADIKEVIKLGEGFEKQTEKALEQMAQVYNLDTKQFKAVKELVKDTGMAFDEAVKAAGFSQYGEDIVDGAVEGVDSRKKNAREALVNSAREMQEAFKDTNKIKSPSRVFKELGAEIPEGIRLGVESGRKGPIDSIKNIAEGMKNSLSGLSASFQSIGSQSIAGMRRGLDASKGSLFAKAGAIANSVAGTMKGALKIKSPSRVMMDIGRWIPEGLADGIAGNAKAVYNAVEAMSDGVQTQGLSLSYDTPAGFKSSLAGAVSGTVNVNARDEMIADAIGSLESKLTNLRIEMDKREFGRAVSDTTTVQRDASVRGGGRRRI